MVSCLNRPRLSYRFILITSLRHYLIPHTSYLQSTPSGPDPFIPNPFLFVSGCFYSISFSITYLHRMLFLLLPRSFVCSVRCPFVFVCVNCLVLACNRLLPIHSLTFFTLYTTHEFELSKMRFYTHFTHGLQIFVGCFLPFTSIHFHSHLCVVFVCVVFRVVIHTACCINCVPCLFSSAVCLLDGCMLVCWLLLCFVCSLPLFGPDLSIHTHHPLFYSH